MAFMRKADLGIHIMYVMVLITLGVNGWRPFKISISNHTIESFSPMKCRCNVTFTESRIFDLHVEFLSIIRNPSMYTGLYFESDNGKYDMEVLNRTIDLCKFYRNKRYEPILQVIFKLFDDSLSHWARGCPMKKGVYYLKNVELNVEKLPPFFPEKNGFYDAVILDKLERLFRIKVFFQIFKTFKKTKN